VGGLTDVACPPGRIFCLAIGENLAGAPVSASWDGTRWVTRVMPAVLSHLSCASPAFCLAVSGDPVRDERANGIWNGSRWRTAPPVVIPRGATTLEVTGVSCTRPAYCMAVGAYTLDRLKEVSHTLAEVWDGRGWHQLRSPRPGKESSFNAVSCVAGSGCMAVGNSEPASGGGSNMAARWRDGAWRVFSLPGGAGYGSEPIYLDSGPAAISCASLAHCMAAGSYLSAGGLGVNLAVAWNGTAWRLTRIPGPRGGLAGVSCPRPGWCAAVGGARRRTLAEAWNGRNWQRRPSANP
jgi:hypothetical protein